MVAFYEGFKKMLLRIITRLHELLRCLYGDITRFVPSCHGQLRTTYLHFKSFLRIVTSPVRVGQKSKPQSFRRLNSSPNIDRFSGVMSTKVILQTNRKRLAYDGLPA